MKKLLVLGLLGVAVLVARADKVYTTEERHYVTPIEIALASPLQLPCTVPYSSWRVWGIRADLIYGRSYQVYGIDVGLSGRLYQDMAGIQATAFNWVDGDASGIQLGAIANLVRGDAAGIQAGLVNLDHGSLAGVQCGLVNYDSVFYGVQFGLVNWDGGISYGWQVAPVNVTDNEFHGVSDGLVNVAERMHGFQIGMFNTILSEGDGVQIGLFNSANNFEGVQLGLLNIIQNGALPIMAFLNANF